LTLTNPVTAATAINGGTGVSGRATLTKTTVVAESRSASMMEQISAQLSPLATPETTLAQLVPTPTPQAALNPALAPTPDGSTRTVNVPILMYHYLSVPPADADIYRQDLSVAPELFAAQLDAMKEAGYTTISLYALQGHLMQGTPLPPNPVVITFDDGYRDNYENALPLLREREMTATFFVVTDFMDEERPAYLTWEMARAMRDAGMDIESHGRNHVTLAGQDVDYLVWQALGSSETIEYELGERPRFISYPAGEFDDLTTEVFQSAGYWAGFTTRQGATHSSEDDLFELRRVRVRGTTTPEELLRLLALDW
jgi:peptidoglycan/xylan/chitin deacetylase (PgdA/CDA1 family)